jgi:hypothetical protein
MLSNERYNLSSQDKTLLTAASALLRKIAAAELTQPAELVSIAKLQYVLSRLPRVTKNVTVAVSIQSPRRKFGEIKTWHWWDVCAADSKILISSGGHFHRPSTGGDSFTTMNWIASPGEDPAFDDYVGSLSIVPDVQSFPDAVASIDFTAEAYILRVDDADNPFLEDEADGDRNSDNDAQEELQAEPEPALEEEVSDDRSPQPWIAVPVNNDEVKLMFLVVNDDIAQNDAQFASGVSDCDGCGNSLDNHGLFIDGRLREQTGWANLCAKCFIHMGEGVGWGKGQMYAKQPNGDWRMVAGFPPNDSD